MHDVNVNWAQYTANRSLRDITEEFGTDDPYLCAQRFVSSLPDMYGIVLRESWRATFAAEAQLTRVEVTALVAQALGNLEIEWRGAENVEPESADSVEDPVEHVENDGEKRADE